MTAVGRALAVAAHKLGPDRDAVLARLAGAFGDDARASAAELVALDAAKQKLARAEWAVAARAPVPPGFRAIHPTWIEAALAPLPARARAVVAGGGGGAPADVWLARWATSGVVAMPPIIGASTPRTPELAGALDPDAALVWLSRIGADQLAFALGSAIGVMGKDLREAAARIRVAPRIGQLGPVRAAIERCEAQRGDEQIRVVEIGAAAVAPHLSPVVRRQLVARLPYAVGAGVARAFEANAASPLARCPTWTALAAG